MSPDREKRRGQQLGSLAKSGAHAHIGREAGEVKANESRGHNAGFISARKLSQVISRPKRGPRPLFYYFIAREVESGPLCIAKKRTKNTERIAKQDLK